METKVLIILLAAVSLAVGCGKENNNHGGQPTGAFTVNATQPTTRTILDDSNVLTWTATDQVGLVKADGSTNEQFTTKAEDITNEGKNAKFTGSALTAGDYYAYYPHCTNAPTASANAVSLAGQTQDGTKKDHVGAYDIMVSDKVTVTESQTEANFTFRHIGALHQFGVYLKAAEAGVKVTGLTFRAHKGNTPVNVFATGVYFDPSTGEAKASALSAEAALTVTNGPELGADPSKPFVMNLMMCNQGATSYPYTIDVEVATNKGVIVFADARTVNSAADEFQAGKRYTKTMALDMSTTTGLEVPDANFRVYLGSQGITFSGNYIDLANPANVALLASTTAIDCRDDNIADLTGIEYFPNLTYLDCSDNSLTTLDVSRNTALTALICNGNSLKTLDVSMLPELTGLACYNNSLTTLDMLQNTVLTELYCGENSLTTLDVSKNTVLAYLYCDDNSLTSLDVSKNTVLIELRCSASQLTSLDVSGCAALTDLECSSTLLTSLDVSGCAALTSLICNGNKLTSLDVSGCAALTSLICNGNKLTSLDVSQNTALTGLICNSNSLISLDVSKNTALTYLDCSSNPLTGLNVSLNTALTTLKCGSSRLTSLDVSKNTALTKLDCNGNTLTSLSVSMLPTLTYLYCNNNPLTTLDVSQNPKLTQIWCYDTQLTALDLSHNPDLVSLQCYGNSLTTLDVSRNTKLTELQCYGNKLAELDITTVSALRTFAAGAQTAGTITLYLTQAQFDGSWTPYWSADGNNTNITASIK